MAWQFWKRKQQAEPRQEVTEEALDAYQAVRGLLLMYGKELPPFSQWRTTDAAISDAIKETAELACKSYQLWLWFILFEDKFGKIASRMARDALFLLLNDLSDDSTLGVQCELLLKIQDDAYKAAEEIPDDKKFVDNPAGGNKVELPREYLIAGFLLFALDTSPHHQQEKPEFDDHTWELAECLSGARSAVLTPFVTMLENIVSFDAGSFPQWTWHADASAHERHLQRRYNNPLFTAARRVVNAQDVYQAREKDAAAIQNCSERVERIQFELFNAVVPSDPIGFLNEIREELDEVGDDVKLLGVRAYWLAERIDRLRESAIDIWKATVGGSAERLKALEDAKSHYRDHVTAPNTDLLRQLAHRNNIIPPEEVIPSLLSESFDDFSVAIKMLEMLPAFVETRKSALHLLKSVYPAEPRPLEITQKLVTLKTGV
jgi:hypothetical protein